MAVDLTGLTDGSTSWGSPLRTALTYLDTKFVQQPAQANTSGATLAALETEVNGLKAKLRALGLMAP